MIGNPLENITGRLVAAEMAAANHRPNMRITHRDGTTYRTLPSGAWVRITERRCNRPGGNGEIMNKCKHRRVSRLA